MGIENLEKKLYEQTSPKAKESAENNNLTPVTAVPAEKSQEKINVETTWQKVGLKEEPGLIQKTVKKVEGPGKILFWSFLGIFIVALFIGLFFVFKYSEAKNIELTASAPNDVLIGIPFKIQIEVLNNTNVILKKPTINVTLPDGASFAFAKETNIYSEEIIDLDPDSSNKIEVPVVINSDENITKDFKISITYSAKGPIETLKITKEANVEVIAKNKGLKLDLVAPQTILNNEEFEIKIDYLNTSLTDFSNLQIALDFPQKDLTLISQNPKPTSPGIWKVAKLVKGQKQTITIKAKANAPEKSFFEIKATAKSISEILNEKIANINVSPSPLGINITTSIKDSFVYPGDEIQYSINYQNNSDIPLADVVIKTKLQGSMFDFSSIRTDGFYNSVDNSITWNASNNSDLKSISPNTKDLVYFKIKTNPSLTIKKSTDKNFAIKVIGEISSPTIPYYVAAEKTNNSTENITKISGLLNLDPTIKYRDTSVATNKGTLPLRANKTTGLTVHWKLSAEADDFKNIEIRASLQPGINWTGKVKSSTTNLPVYNENSQEIVWKIDKISANKGVLSTPYETIFQIEATPSTSQLGGAMPIISDVVVTATDEYTGETIKGTIQSLNSTNISEVISKLYSGTVN